MEMRILMGMVLFLMMSFLLNWPKDEKKKPKV